VLIARLAVVVGYLDASPLELMAQGVDDELTQTLTGLDCADTAGTVQAVRNVPHVQQRHPLFLPLAPMDDQE
jgi:hypothetical protein